MAVKEVYIVATEEAEPLGPEAIGEAFETDEVTVELDEAPGSFRLRSAEAEIAVRFEALEAPLGWTPELLNGSEAAHARLRRARGLYRLGYDTPPGSQPTVGVFEALWCARGLLEKREGVLVDASAFKVHEEEDVREITELDFDIRDHVTLHPVPTAPGDAPLWVHSHGMAKFGQNDVEIFQLSEQDLLPAESFLHELCTDLAFGEGPTPRIPMETSNGEAFMLVSSEEARHGILRVSPDTFEGHEGEYWTVVSPEGRHTTSELLRPYRSRFEQEDPSRSEALASQAARLRPAFKARFHRRGLMEPLTFLVRAPFETHPDGEAVQENLWLEVLAWEEARITGKLVDGAAQTTEWRKGATVEIDEDSVNAVAMGRDGRPLDDEEMQGVLLAERPS
ncbi:MAG TPA: DUF2314 domain-containing protein [Myxococcaceae bacterium]|nr:DUF2314 domain-containing protein [Myxococcaceae bacterium]